MENRKLTGRSFGLPITIVAVGVLLAGFYLTQRAAEPREGPAAAAPAAVAGTRIEPGSVAVRAADPVLGGSEAPVTIVLFTQFHCAFCRHFFEATLGPLKEQLIDTGQVRLVVKVFPLGDGEQAVEAAERAARAAYCAQAQGRFWTYAGRLSAPGAQYEVSDLAGFAQAEGLPAAQFADCLDSAAAADAVADSIRMAVAAGIVATPTFIINNELHEGALSYADIVQRLP